MATPTHPIREYGAVPPVLSPDEWQRRRRHLAALGPVKASKVTVPIALLNDSIAPDDPHKIGWDYVDRLRTVAARLLDPLHAPALNLDQTLEHTADALALGALADVLASYLPPRSTA